MTVAALVLLVFVSTAHADEIAPSTGALQVAERDYDAGKIERGVTLKHTFLLKNAGMAELSVDAKPG
jgi:hypothetical protein